MKKAGTILINKETKSIGLVFRKNKNDFSFPKGHLEEGESLIDCAIRETIEETGRNVKIINDNPVYIIKYYTEKEKNVEVYLYLAIDMGKIRDEIDEELVWVKVDKVYDKLSYENLKACYKEVYPIIKEYL